MIHKLQLYECKQIFNVIHFLLLIAVILKKRCHNLNGHPLNAWNACSNVSNISKLEF